MTRPINQTLTYVSQDTIAALNEMVGGGFFLGYLATLEDIENKIFSDCNGTFVEATGEPRPGTFQNAAKYPCPKKTICKHSMPSALKAQRKVDGLNF